MGDVVGGERELDDLRCQRQEMITLSPFPPPAEGHAHETPFQNPHSYRDVTLLPHHHSHITHPLPNPREKQGYDVFFQVPDVDPVVLGNASLASARGCCVSERMGLGAYATFP